MIEKQQSELRSGITAPFNKRLNEALQFDPQMPFHIENNVSPSLLTGILKGEQGTPGLPASLSVVKDNNNLIMLAVSPIERGNLKMKVTNLVFGGTGAKTIKTIVPTGKKWIIKGLMNSGSGTATIGYRYLAFFDPNNTLIKLSSDMATTIGTAYAETLVLSDAVLLPEGWSIASTYSVSADTNGAMKQTLLYQEIDI